MELCENSYYRNKSFIIKQFYWKSVDKNAIKLYLLRSDTTLQSSTIKITMLHLHCAVVSLTSSGGDIPL